MGIEQNIKPFLNNDDKLPRHLGHWLDLPIMDFEGHRNMAVLSYWAFSLISLIFEGSPRFKSGQRYWSLGYLGRELRGLTREGNRFPREIFENASRLVVLELASKGLLERRGDILLEDDIKRSTRFRLVSTREALSQAYEYFAFLGEVAGIDQSEIEAHRRVARELMS